MDSSYSSNTHAENTHALTSTQSAANPIISLSFDSRNFVENEQFERWRDLAGNVGIIERDQKTEAPFHAYTSNYYTSSAILSLYGANQQSSLDRTAQIAASSGDEAFSIQLRVSGTEYETSMPSEELQHAGSLRIIDLSRPFYSANKSHQVISLVLHKREMFDRIPELMGMHGVFLPNTPMTQLFKKQLMSVSEIIPKLTQAEAQQAVDIVSDMFWACLTSLHQPDILESEVMDKAVLQAVRHCIDQNLHNPELSPIMIAHKVAVSRSKLFSVCHAFGGPMELVRFKRLRRALALLKSGQSKNVTDTAYAVGFENRETFSRSFKKEFGFSPREFVQSYNRSIECPTTAGMCDLPEWQLRNTMLPFQVTT